MSRQPSPSASADRSRYRPALRCRPAILFPLLLLASALFVAPATLAEPAGERSADSRDVSAVVELFTSQGCSACPEADETLTSLSKEDGGPLTLSYHVDYWDYIGWKDPLVNLRNAERQRGYAKALRQTSLHTPQMILNGDREIAGADRAAVDEALGGPALADREPGARIAMTRDDTTLHILAEAPPEPVADEQTVLILVTYRGTMQTAVERGENGGRHLVNTHAVHDWQVVGKMAGKPMDIDMPVKMLAGADEEDFGCAALLQRMEEDGTPGPILAAAVLPF